MPLAAQTGRKTCFVVTRYAKYEQRFTRRGKGWTCAGSLAQAVWEAAKAAFHRRSLTRRPLCRYLGCRPIPDGRYGFPLLFAVKALRMGRQIAQQAAGRIDCPAIDRAEVKGGYLNLFLNRAW